MRLRHPPHKKKDLILPSSMVTLGKEGFVKEGHSQRLMDVDRAQARLVYTVDPDSVSQGREAF